MKTKIIVNPAAGGGRPLKILPELIENLKKIGLAPDWQITSQPKEASQLAQRAADEGCQLVVAVGGDGTVNEVVNGLADSSSILAVIPAGSGNDFFKMLNLPTKIPGICQNIAQKNCLTVDLGLVNNYHFINSVGLGFAGETAAHFKRNRRTGGLLGYLKAVLKIFFQAKPVKIYLKSEKINSEENIFLAAISNGHSMGGGFKLTPLASVTDGLLDVCLIDYRHPLRLLPHLPRAITGHHLKLPFVKMFHCREVVIKCKSPQTAHFDGEVVQIKELNVKIKHKKLKVIGGTSTHL